jgi:hypothetical protein
MIERVRARGAMPVVRATGTDVAPDQVDLKFESPYVQNARWSDGRVAQEMTYRKLGLDSKGQAPPLDGKPITEDDIKAEKKWIESLNNVPRPSATDRLKAMRQQANPTAKK